MMQDKKPARRTWIVGLLIVVLAVSLFSPAMASAEPSFGTALVWVTDVSGSMPQVDRQRLWSNAVSLGIDLAPENTQAAFIAVNDKVVAQTDLLDLSQPDNVAAIKQMARSVKITGDTDFSAGLSAALDLLKGSTAKEKGIYFVGDFVEAGFLPKDGNYSQVETTMASLTQQLADAGIKVHLIFLRTPTQNQQYIPLWDALAAKTGGDITKLDNPAELQQTVESLYFSDFQYNMSVMSGVNTTNVTQNIPVSIPSFAQNRVRIYISASSQLPGIQAWADSTQLSLTQNGTYDIIDLLPPLPKTVTLTLPPSKSGSMAVKVYTLVDGGMTMTASADSVAEKDDAANQYRQKTTVTLTPSLSGALPSDASWTVTATDPSGQTTAITTAQYTNGAFVYDFYPQSFGTYTFALTVVSGGIQMTAESTADVSAIDLPVIQSVVQRDYSLWIAIGIGVLLILAAILFAIFHRRRDKSVKGAPVPVPLSAPAAAPAPVEEQPAGVFGGKLDFYGVLVDGGKAEVPATSYRLSDLAKSRSTTLGFVMKEAGVPYQYPAAEHIKLSPGTGHMLVVKNNSGAAVYCGGQALGRGQQAVLDYGQKMRVAFAEEVNEYEIYYHNTVQMAVSGSRIRIELNDE